MICLGLDISSSTIGYTVCTDGVLTAQGRHKPLKTKHKKKILTIAERLSETYKSIFDIVGKISPDEIVIEDYARKFSQGKSSAATIIILSCFNEVVSMACIDSIGVIPKKYPVSSIRKTMGLSGKVEKEDVLEKILEIYPNFKVCKNRVGGTQKETFDEADSLAVIYHHLSEV